MSGKTVRIYLKEGSPNNLLIAEIINWTGKVFVASRSQLVKLVNRPEVRQTGLYILVGQDPDEIIRERVYIGESDNVWSRLSQHNEDANKDFWDKTIIIISKDENLTKAHARYLESRLIKLAQQAGRASLANSTNPPSPPLPESDTDDMNYFLEQIQILLPVLGFSFIQVIPSAEVLRNTSQRSSLKSSSSPLFYINLSNGATAEAREVEGEFVVLQGSRAKKEATPSLRQTHVQIRKLFYQEGKVRDDEHKQFWIFKEDIPFSSASSAASFITGVQSNGRIVWKVKGSTQTYKDWQQNQIEQATNSENSFREPDNSDE